MTTVHIPVQAIKGRGVAHRQPHRFERDQRAAFDDGWGTLDEATAAGEEAAPPATQVTFEDARSAITHNDSPDIGFTLGLNPYRGCEHGCIYCYARPTHSYLNLSPGLDFETRIIAKRNIAAVLRSELLRPAYAPDLLAIGTVTDAYQPVERELRLTRAVLELLHTAHHPLAMVTKGSGVERDIDLLAPMGAQRLAEAGVPTGVSVSPQIPFINDDMERVLEAAYEAGARRAFYQVLRLPWELRDMFRLWLEQHYPDRAARVMARIQDMRGGKDYDADFATRMKGQGIWARVSRPVEARPPMVSGSST